MLHEIAGMPEFLRRTYVDPRAVDGIICYLIPASDGIKQEIRGISAFPMRQTRQQRIGEYVDAGICEMRGCGFFRYPGHPRAIGGEDGIRHRHCIGDGGNGGLRPLADMVQIHLLEVDGGQ